MDNDTKNLLMQYLGRFAEHYEIPDFATYSFKKRGDLMDKLKVKNNDAWVIMNDLFGAFLKFDRIQNDKEKFDKARVLWEAEHAAAEKEKVNAEMHLIQFCKADAIPIGTVAMKETLS
ncbi:MAG: hypothetical protein PSX36_11575 [bacterium]|nr:hypothetical protein [bacterium]